MWAGLGLITFALVYLPFVLRDPWDSTRLGLPAWLLTALLMIVGACCATYGAIWFRKDRRAGSRRD
ncbi:hypothetical protein CLV46_0253 [Diaminobutyricimonas aerilata]|uniref:Uncharacterized protein n=1 Tax=Diaminobutyricimonas aerilata TaxID=1162967 RepID=A0A2M9CFT3_9MICO|nr:hypothetical protein CLV46_0253 [Diaminobutyricimonas aerilata]